MPKNDQDAIATYGRLIDRGVQPSTLTRLASEGHTAEQVASMFDSNGNSVETANPEDENTDD
jgi:hypothetical protein